MKEVEISTSGNFDVMNPNDPKEPLMGDDGQPVKEKREGTFVVMFPENAQEAIDVYGEKIVYDIFEAKLRVRVQDEARRDLGSGEFRPDKYRDWRPDETRTRGPARKPETLEKQFDLLPESEQQKFVESLMARMGIQLDPSVFATAGAEAEVQEEEVQ